METTSRGSLVRWIVAGLIGLILLGGVGVYALRVYLPELVYSRVRAEAKTAGIELTDCATFEFERKGFEVTHVLLENCTFTSALPMKPSGSVEKLEIDLSNNAPTRVAIAGALVTVLGDLQLIELQNELNAPTGVEVVGQRNGVAWVPAEGAPPRLEIKNLQHLASSDPWSGDVIVGDLLQGRFVFGKELTLDLEQRTNAKNALRLRLDPSQFFGTLSLDFEGLPMTLLSGVVFHNVPPELLTVQLTGSAKFDLPFGLNPKQPTGRFKFSFQGLNFPVPPEVAGLVYDTSPEVEGDIEINRTFSKFKVEGLKFATGSLRMKGSAAIEREGTDTRWRSTLRGPLPCEAIASAAAKIHLKRLPLGLELAQAAAKISKQAIKGSVEILVVLDAHSTDLSAAKVVKTIGIGCGLKPFPVVGVAQDLLKDLPQFSLGGGSVSDVLKDLPTLSDLPKLPKLPQPGKKQAAESNPGLGSQ